MFVLSTIKRKVNEYRNRPPKRPDYGPSRLGDILYEMALEEWRKAHEMQDMQSN